MNKETIISALASGKYKITYEQNCGCRFGWHVDSQYHLDDDCDSDECWEGNVLYVYGEPIAQHIRYESREMLTKLLCEDDIPDEIWDKMSMSDISQRGESANCPEHDSNRREGLIDWLMEQDEYELDKDDKRGFANEYTVILRRSDNPDATIRDQAVKWADAYLYAGDAATDAYIGLRVENK